MKPSASAMEQSKTLAHQEPLTQRYPLSLIKAFRAGCVVFATGMLLLLLMIFVDFWMVGIACATCLTIGSGIVVFALLRGQEIDEQNA